MIRSKQITCATIVRLNYTEPKVPEQVLKISDSAQSIKPVATPAKNQTRKKWLVKLLHSFNNLQVRLSLVKAASQRQLLAHQPHESGDLFNLVSVDSLLLDFRWFFAAFHLRPTRVRLFTGLQFVIVLAAGFTDYYEPIELQLNSILFWLGFLANWEHQPLFEVSYQYRARGLLPSWRWHYFDLRVAAGFLVILGLRVIKWVARLLLGVALQQNQVQGFH